MPHAIPDTGSAVLSKVGKIPATMELAFWWKETDKSQTNRKWGMINLGMQMQQRDVVGVSGSSLCVGWLGKWY